MVILAATKIVGHALHVSDFFVEVMSVLVAFAVADLLHQFRYGIADVQRDRFSRGLFYILLNRAIGGV